MGKIHLLILIKQFCQIVQEPTNYINNIITERKVKNIRHHHL